MLTFVASGPLAANRMPGGSSRSSGALKPAATPAVSSSAMHEKIRVVASSSWWVAALAGATSATTTVANRRRQAGHVAARAESEAHHKNMFESLQQQASEPASSSSEPEGSLSEPALGECRCPGATRRRSASGGVALALIAAWSQPEGADATAIDQGQYCRYCKGPQGSYGQLPCAYCSGTGQWRIVTNNTTGDKLRNQFNDYYSCPNCLGNGSLICQNCYGTGLNSKELKGWFRNPDWEEAKNFYQAYGVNLGNLNEFHGIVEKTMDKIRAKREAKKAQKEAEAAANEGKEWWQVLG